MWKGTSNGASVMIVTWTNTMQWHKIAIINNGEEKPMTDWENCTKNQVTEGDTNYTKNSNVERYFQWGWCDDSDMDKYHSMAQDSYNKYWTDLQKKESKCVTREDIKYVLINLIQIKVVVQELMS